MTTELKKCPFCNKNPFKIHGEPLVGCSCIGVEERVDFLISKWNTRPLEKQARLEALQECLSELNSLSLSDELKHEGARRSGISLSYMKIQALIDKEKGKKQNE